MRDGRPVEQEAAPRDAEVGAELDAELRPGAVQRRRRRHSAELAQLRRLDARAVVELFEPSRSTFHVWSARSRCVCQSARTRDIAVGKVSQIEVRSDSCLISQTSHLGSPGVRSEVSFPAQRDVST